MTDRRARAALLAVIVPSVVLVVAEAVTAPGPSDLVALLVPLSFLAVGTLVALQQPRNGEAWLLVVTGIAFAVAFGLPFDGSWVVPVTLMTTHLLLRFPNGRLPSPRWAAFSWFCVALPLVLSVVVTASSPEAMAGGPNPYYVPWTAALVPVIALLPAAMLVSAWSLVSRYRRAGSAQRHQIRWIAFAGVWVVAWYAVTLGVSLAYDQRAGIDSSESSWFSSGYPWWLTTLQMSALLSFTLIPAAFGVAILRFRLYDIDRLVSRTTSYLIVSGLVIATYVLVVSLASGLLGASSSLSVAAATLAAAAAVRPLLRRVRSAVDRRFDRAHFDAVHTTELFARDLQSLVDTDEVAERMSEAVAASLQPAHLRLWLRERP
jgi:hypothetical protein